MNPEELLEVITEKIEISITFHQYGMEFHQYGMEFHQYGMELGDFWLSFIPVED